ncbi:hypothetical protein ACIOEX_28645 [Streptomyces sp. NPDC087850]|uniref:hypothetical protein n=1 Tax=Streptomyces sp. NPDC087850 TaxID=3365809 RepID=UPI0038209C56
MVIVSSNAGTEVSAEYAERVEALVEAAAPARETVQGESWKTCRLTIRLYAYAAPGSEAPRWAVDYSDDASRELTEYDSREAADLFYEKMVRETAEHLGEDHDGIPVRFASTDVEGVPGPLPELPVVDTDDIRTLLDQVAEDAVLYVERGEDGEVWLAFGPAAHVPPRTVLLTRYDILELLGLYDEHGSRITRQDVDADDDVFLEDLAGIASEAARAAVGALFPAGPLG